MSDEILTYKIKTAGILEDIDSIEHSRSYNLKYKLIYTVVTGYDDGKKVAIWLTDKNDLVIHYRVDLNDGLSKDEAIDIANKKGLTLDVSPVTLLYVEKTTDHLDSGVYWLLRGRQGEYAYISFLTGKYVVFNASNGEWK